MTFCSQRMRQSMHSQDGLTHQQSTERSQASAAPFFSFSQDSILSLLSLLLVVPVSVVLHITILRTLSALLPLL